MGARENALVLGVALAVALSAAASAHAADLWVAGASPACNDARTPAQAGSSATPWCTLARAAAAAAPGDVVRVLPATYRETLRPLRSGTPAAPIRFAAAAPGVAIDVAGAATAVKLIGVSDISIEGFELRGAAAQGVWLDATARVTLSGLRVTRNAGAGVQVKASSGLRFEHSTIDANGRAGVLELAGTTGARYTHLTVTGNGIGNGAYNGDGIQLGGSGALVADSTIARNGDPGPYEHGVYAAASSSGWTIERSTLTANGGANVKAAGGPGTIRDSVLVDGRYGIVLSDNPVPVAVERNEIRGRAQHLVFLTAGAAPARARLLDNTILQTGRATASGDASAVFVNAAASLELRRNTISYSGADALGVALWVNDATRLGGGGIVSGENAFCSTDAQSRHLAWNGSRTTLAGWRTATGQDAVSTAAAAPC